jgi:hypothetical protein
MPAGGSRGWANDRRPRGWAQRARSPAMATTYAAIGVQRAVKRLRGGAGEMHRQLVQRFAPGDDPSVAWARPGHHDSADRRRAEDDESDPTLARQPRLAQPSASVSRVGRPARGGLGRSSSCCVSAGRSCRGSGGRLGHCAGVTILGHCSLGRLCSKSARVRPSRVAARAITPWSPS